MGSRKQKVLVEAFTRRHSDAIMHLAAGAAQSWRSAILDLMIICEELGCQGHDVVIEQLLAEEPTDYSRNRLGNLLERLKELVDTQTK